MSVQRGVRILSPVVVAGMMSVTPAPSASPSPSPSPSPSASLVGSQSLPGVLVSAPSAQPLPSQVPQVLISASPVPDPKWAQSAEPAPDERTDKKATLVPIWDVEVSHLIKPPELSWSKDPFRKIPGWAVPVAKEEKEARPKLEAVIVQGQEREAVINGRRFRMGELLGDRVIASIGENYVILKEGGSLWELSISASRIPDSKVSISELDEIDDGELDAAPEADVDFDAESASTAPAKVAPQASSAQVAPGVTETSPAENPRAPAQETKNPPAAEKPKNAESYPAEEPGT